MVLRSIKLHERDGMSALSTRRGKRRSQEERRKALLDAASALFLKFGYAGTSLDAIIERAGGSKRDIYTEFSNKEGLYIALIDEVSKKVLKPFLAEKIETQDLRHTLYELGYALMSMLFSPLGMSIYHTIVRDCVLFPELAERFYAAGPQKGIAAMTDVLKAAQAKGEVVDGDAGILAEHFFAMLRSNMHMKSVLHLRPLPDRTEIEALVSSAVDVFLNGIIARH